MNTIKHTIYTLAVVLLMSAFAQAQMRGKWVLPTNYAGVTSTVYQLTFDATGVSRDAIQSLNGSENFVVSAGGYNLNYDRNFHALHKTLYYGQSETPLYTSSQTMLPGLQIIQKANVENEYFAVYINEGAGHDIGVWYNALEYDYNSGNPILSVSTPLGVIGGLTYRPAFTMTDLQNNERFVYIASVSEETSIRKGRLVRWRLGTNGFTDPVVLLEDGDQPLTDVLYFEAYKMENSVNNGEAVVAWIHGLNDSNYTGWNHTDEIVVVSDTVVRNFDLNLGRIGGIEFSTYEPGIIYASCTNRGIVKLNYTTGQVTNLYAPTPANFSRTALQTAPDGHIYAVSNDGSKLGRILQHGSNAGTFEANNVLDFPQDETLATYQVFDNLTYYVLPENKRVYTPLEVSVTTQPESCPHANDGRVEISVSGGVPYNDVDAPYLITSVPAMSWQWDTEGLFFYQEELTKGVYFYTITDNATPLPNVIDGSFVIEVDNSYFDFKNDFFQVESSTSLPNSAYPNTTYSFEKGIHVHAGATLTINNCYFEFGSGAKIIIEPNAKLIVNNSTLTNSPVCDLPWQGVEVWGNSNASQWPDANGDLHQGYCELKNNATIAHAHTAINLWKPNDYHTTGGIVIASDAVFRNNVRAIHALYYDSYNPANPTQLLDYRGLFTNCVFETDANYLGQETFYKHIDLNQVNGLRFSGCDFSVSPNAQNVAGANMAIAAYNAGFRVEALCTNNTQPCNSYDSCSFAGFYRAIFAGNTSSVHTFSVSKAVFNNNTTGIYANGVNNLSVLFSEFLIGKNTADLESCESKGKLASGFGIDLNHCFGFAIEENYFTKAADAPTGIYTGIRIAETQATDQVYKNTFEGLSYGNYAVGQNWTSGQQWKGLAYYCNENTGNYEDFTVEDVLDQEDGIQDPQGSELLPAGNTFSPNATYHFNNWDNNDWIGYYYYAPAPGVINTVYYPDNVNRVTREPVVGIQNTCPPHYSGGGGTIERGLVLSPEQKLETELAFASNLSAYSNVKVLHENLKDGGNTEATLSDIETAWPQDMWELRSELLGRSPHLSLDVLKATADKTDVLPDNVIFEILAANPDELKKEELIKYLEDKTNPLPDYMVDILRQVAMGSTYKTVLIRQMGHYNQVKTKAAYDIVRSILNDSIINISELRSWLDNIGGKRADEQIIASYLSEGNYTEATALANMMPALYDYADDEVAEHDYYMEMLNLQISLAQQAKSIFELDSSEINNLVYMADNSRGTAGTQAKSILEYAYGYNYCNCISDNEAGYKSSNALNPDSFTQLLGIEITVEPNPATDWAVFNYTLADSNAEGVIKIMDLKGSFITSLSISGMQGQKVWDTRKLKAGVYFYTLKVAGYSISGKIVVSK